MDIPRIQPRRRLRVPTALAVTGALIVAALAATRTLRSAAPSVPRSGVVIATVKQGVFEREVRAPGRLVPQETRWVTAVSPGRVDAINEKPGALVHPDTIILTLQNPDVVLASLEADRDVTTAEAAALELETRMGTQGINEEATVASLEADLANAERRAQVYGSDTGLLVPKLDQTQMEERADALSRSLSLARDRVKVVHDKGRGAVAAWREQLVRRRKVAEFRRAQVEALKVRAGGEGVLMDLPVEPGQWAPPGAVLANIVQPEKLKGELRVLEGQARDITLGMSADIDTHNGVIPGHIVRVAAGARDGVVIVEVALDGPLPGGSRPQLNVDGTVHVESVRDALFVDRPASAREGSTCSLYRLAADDMHVERVTVTLGRASALTVEVRSGLQAGDRVVVSDTNAFDGDRVALR